MPWAADSSRTTRRKTGRDERHQQHDTENPRIHGRFGRPDPEQHVLDEAGQQHGAGSAGHASGEHRQRSTEHDVADHVGTARAQSHANAHFLGTLGDCVGCDPVNADRAQHDGKAAKDAGEHHG